MIERVAEAIADNADDPVKAARAALAVLRLPTREMIEAGVFSMKHGSRDPMYDDSNLEVGYQAMIDKALGHALRVHHKL
jgi:hypothetical protein